MPRPPLFLRLGRAARLALGAALVSGCAGAAALDRVALQLKWKHQFQFAGYYVAAEKGYYREAGFDVQLVEAQGADTIDAVLAGRAQYGVAGSELALRRGLGDPVVALATILQHSALALAVRGGRHQTIHDLAGRSLMLSPHDQELLAYLQREGLTEGRLRRVAQSYDIQDLIQGRVDGFSVYTTDQVWQLQKSGLAYTLLSPRAAGIDFYGDTLFTTQATLRQAPARVKAFRDASIRGWQYAMEHPEETVDLILARYSQRLPREHLLFEAAQMKRLMQPQLIEVGHMNPGRWRHVASVYAEIGMLPPGSSLDGFLLDEAAGAPDGRAPWRWLVAVLVLLSAVAVVILYRNQRRLRRALAALSTPPAPTGSQAPVIDASSGLFTAAYLEHTLAREMHRAQDAGTPIALALLRLDAHAGVTAADGPGAGDALVRALAEPVLAALHGAEFACRVDAGTVGWVLPGCTGEQARERALAIAQPFARRSVWSGLVEVHSPVSVGVADGTAGTDGAGLVDAARRALSGWSPAASGSAASRE